MELYYFKHGVLLVHSAYTNDPTLEAGALAAELGAPIEILKVICTIHPDGSPGDEDEAVRTAARHKYRWPLMEPRPLEESVD